jgi:RimJ/RimL family protein N-acetyltransferase
MPLIDTQATDARLRAYAYQHHIHGPDFLVHWWHVVRSHGETLRMFHEASVSPFLLAWSQMPLWVIAVADAAWHDGQGIAGVIWSDVYKTTDPDARTSGACGGWMRVHFWAAPDYRVPRWTTPMATLGINALFETTGVSVLWGLTPVTNRAAIAAIRRWGFRQVALWPMAELDVVNHALVWVDAVFSLLTREDWHARGQHP